MGENTITKPLGLVLIIAAHMVFNDPSHAEVIGTLGRNITIQFIFNCSISNKSHIGVYTTGEKKIAQHFNGESSFDIYPQNSSVIYHITNLTLNHSNTYWASLFDTNGLKNSNKVRLIVEGKNTSSTAPPTLTTHTGSPANKGNSTVFITNIVIILAVLPVVLLATVLPWLICSLVKPKEMGSGDDVKPSLALNKQQQQQQQQQQRPAQSSALTVQESVESSSSMPAPSVIYSVLDFPRRPPTAVEINPRDTEYAAVSYLSEKRYM